MHSIGAGRPHMIKVISVVKRKAGMEVGAFQKYWLNVHADIVLQMTGIRRYVQSHTLIAGYRKGEPAADGIAELWLDDSDALHALAGTPELAAASADHAAFIAPNSRRQIVTVEHVIKDGTIPDGAVKNIEFVKKKPGMPVDEFQRYWKSVHGPIGAAIAPIRRYVQSHTLVAAYRDGQTPPLDGAALTWFDDTDAMRAAARSAEYAATRADEDNFVSTSLDFIITREHVIVP